MGWMRNGLVVGWDCWQQSVHAKRSKESSQAQHNIGSNELTANDGQSMQHQRHQSKHRQ